MSRNRENKKKKKTQTHFAKQRTIETFRFASLARSLKNIGAMDIAQRLELQTLPFIGHRVHIYYEASAT